MREKMKTEGAHDRAGRPLTEREYRATDPAYRYGAIFRQAEEMRLTREDVNRLRKLRPEVYDRLEFWRATDEA